MESLKKRKLLVLISILILILVAFLLSFRFYFVKVKMEGRKEIPKREEIKKEKTTEEVLESLTPKESKSLNDTEKEEIEKALQSLTPEEQKPKVSEKIEEGLLEQLTPK
jgi:cytoskeletal protein RodZ